MAQETIKINHEFLAHLRLSAGHKQVVVASHCKISERQYQNIEGGKKGTTKVTLALLADFFNVSQEMLTGESYSEDQALWFVRNNIFLEPNITMGFGSVIQEITNQLKAHYHDESAVLSMETDDESKILVSCSSSEEEFSWEIVPVRINEKLGLLWGKMTPWQQSRWLQEKHKLLYSTLDNVFLNGECLSRQENVYFKVEFNTVEKLSKHIHGYSLYEDEEELLELLAGWMKSEVGSIAMPITTFNEDQLMSVYSGACEGKQARLVIDKVVSDGQSLSQAVWSTRQLRSFEAKLKAGIRSVYPPDMDALNSFKPTVIIDHLEVIEGFEIKIN